MLCDGILSRKKNSIAHTSSEFCYWEGKNAFRSLSQNLNHQHEQNRTAKSSNTMVCIPFIQLLNAENRHTRQAHDYKFLTT